MFLQVDGHDLDDGHSGHGHQTFGNDHGVQQNDKHTFQGHMALPAQGS